VIVVDAAAVPGHFSGARTRLRGLLAAYARLDGAPRLGVRVARGARLLDGLDLRSIAVEEVAPPGGPLRRALGSRAPASSSKFERDVELWHSETIPPRAPRGVPAFLTLHDLRWSEPRAATGAPWTQWAPRHLGARVWLPRLARSLAGIVTVSDASARTLVARLRVPAERVHVVANATDGDAAVALDDASSSALLARLGVADDPFLLAVGHLEPRKGIELVLAALARAPRDGANARALARSRLVLVGAGPGEAALRAKVNELELARHVVFAGPLDDAATATLYARAAALVFPSRCEGFGFPVHEALARGCPVVARRIDVLIDAFGSAGHPLLTLLDLDVSAWVATLEERVARATPARPRVAPATPHVWVWRDAAAALAALYSRATPRRGAEVRGS
jgi:glycosyltransferase involved in cell wall biosynthesis